MKEFIINNFDIVILYTIAVILAVIFICITVIVNQEPNQDIDDKMKQIEHCMTEYEISRDQCIIILYGD
jgi:hypothetical protein